MVTLQHEQHETLLRRLAAPADRVARMARMVVEHVVAGSRRRAARRAVARASAAFGQQRPGLAAALFDEHFLAHRAAPIFAGYAPGRPGAAAALAAAWASQFFGEAEARRRRIAEATPAAADFLALLDAELGGRALGRPPHPAPSAGERHLPATFCEALRAPGAS